MILGIESTNEPWTLLQIYNTIYIVNQSYNTVFERLEMGGIMYNKLILGLSKNCSKGL